MRTVKRAFIGLVIALGIAQFIQPDRINPPGDPASSFDALAAPPQHVAAALARACRDCHTGNTVWPWYSRVSPLSWVVARDVKEGRSRLNFSQWNIYGPEMARIRMRQICRAVTTGEMPPKYYTPLHPEARLSIAEMTAVCNFPGS
jgi:hypothetical protein